MPTTTITILGALSAKLDKFARDTAADTDDDYATAVRHMADEPSEVALALGCSREEVLAWTKGQQIGRRVRGGCRNPRDCGDPTCHGECGY